MSADAWKHQLKKKKDLWHLWTFSSITWSSRAGGLMDMTNVAAPFAEEDGMILPEAIEQTSNQRRSKKD